MPNLLPIIGCKRLHGEAPQASPWIMSYAYEIGGLELHPISYIGEGQRREIIHCLVGSQVEGLETANVVLDVFVEPLADLVEGVLVVGNTGSDDEVLDVFEGLSDLLAALNFSAAEIA